MVVVELVVLVAMVVVVEVAVAGGVLFGHPLPPKIFTIISITLSDKVVVLKRKLLSIILCYCTPITTTTPLLPFVTLPAPPSAYPLPLPPHVDCHIAPLLLLACRRQHCEDSIAPPTRHH